MTRGHPAIRGHQSKELRSTGWGGRSAQAGGVLLTDIHTPGDRIEAPERERSDTPVGDRQVGWPKPTQWAGEFVRKGACTCGCFPSCIVQKAASHSFPEGVEVTLGALKPNCLGV